MVEKIRRRSRMMLGLDPEPDIIPPLSPHDLPSTEKMNEEIHSDIESFDPFESQVEGFFETIEEGYLRPTNTPLTDMSILVISEFPTQPSSLSPQKDLSHMEALIVESLGFPSTSQNVPFSMPYLTMVNTQPSNLPTNYRSLADIIGLVRPLTDLIQLGRLDLSSFPNAIPHSIGSSNIPPPSTLTRTTNLAQHGTSYVQNLSSSTRNGVINQPSQLMMNPIIMHSPI